MLEGTWFTDEIRDEESERRFVGWAQIVKGSNNEMRNFLIVL